MTIRETPLPGLVEIQPFVARDPRGTFVKTFHEADYRRLGLPAHYAEEYYSLSHRGVLRGMHFQVPPHDHAKVVTCVAGKVLDVVVDLRAGSPTFGRIHSIELDDERATMLVIPSGMAHGFLALSESAIMYYQVTTAYSREHDAGIRWDSLGIPWPMTDVILSDRDREFPAFADFKSPFVYDAGSYHAK